MLHLSLYAVFLFGILEMGAGPPELGKSAKKTMRFFQNFSQVSNCLFLFFLGGGGGDKDTF